MVNSPFCRKRGEFDGSLVSDRKRVGNGGECAKWATIFLEKARLANSKVISAFSHKRWVEKRQVYAVERAVKVKR